MLKQFTSFKVHPEREKKNHNSNVIHFNRPKNEDLTEDVMKSVTWNYAEKTINKLINNEYENSWVGLSEAIYNENLYEDTQFYLNIIKNGGTLSPVILLTGAYQGYGAPYSKCLKNDQRDRIDRMHLNWDF